jgi:predicted nucleic acid-binding protein
MNAAEVFYDTNVVLYLLSGEAKKADCAEELLAAGGRISVQVLNEFAAVASRKLGMGWPEIGEILAEVRAVCPVESVAIETHERGLAVAARYGLNIYDAMIVASALLAGCKLLYSEDLQHGQVFERQLTVRNPFDGAHPR